MAELRFIIQNGQLLAFLGHRVTVCFVSKLHAEMAYYQTDIYAEKGEGWLEYFLIYFSNQIPTVLLNAFIYLF